MSESSKCDWIKSEKSTKLVYSLNVWVKGRDWFSKMKDEWIFTNANIPNTYVMTFHPFWLTIYLNITDNVNTFMLR